MYGVLSDSEAHHTIAVISAKAEIQALNDQKPPEGRLLTSEKLMAVPRTAGGFLSLLVQRKGTCRGSATHK
jgi:hypothetical protein